MIKKHQLGLFLDTSNGGSSTAYKRIKKSTAITIAMNPATVVYDYIADESPTTELSQYQPSLAQPLTMYENEPDFQYLFDKFFLMATGNEAKTKCAIAYMFMPYTDGVQAGTKAYYAWEGEVVLSLTDMDGVGSVINFDILFGGTIKKGYVTMTNDVPTFTEVPDIEVKFPIPTV